MGRAEQAPRGGAKFGTDTAVVVSEGCGRTFAAALVGLCGEHSVLCDRGGERLDPYCRTASVFSAPARAMSSVWVSGGGFGGVHGVRPGGVAEGGFFGT